MTLLAFFVAALVPFFIVLKWKGGGFVLAVLLGWAVVHGANLVTAVDERGDAVFLGLWAATGWVFMTVWCIICAACVASTRVVVTMIRRLKSR